MFGQCACMYSCQHTLYCSGSSLLASACPLSGAMPEQALEDILDDQEDMANMYLGRKARVRARAARSDSDKAPETGGTPHQDEEMLVSAAHDSDTVPEVLHCALCSLVWLAYRLQAMALLDNTLVDRRIVLRWCRCSRVSLKPQG